MNCTCRSRNIADRCATCRAEHWARWRMNNNTLTWAAKNFDVTDTQWCEYVARYEVDDLHLLLEEES